MLTPELIARIDREIAKYPVEQKQSAVMAALAIAQEAAGWLSPEAIEAVASYLEMSPVAALEVATFYNMYDLKPVGRHKLTVCTNLPCMLSGGMHALEYLQEKLGIGLDETTPDGKFTLKQGECMGACGDAPVLLVNNRHMCCSMTPAEIDRLLAELD
ncbi:NADH-quinone oxidoreductase subunit NuoE [Rhodocyclus tenuis]|uniref:NADH-quinone oxidoreductase subunit E n=1 Tax=Rhodocyclus tenuis TaxID=1066 RepID=A0A840G739_RHOTE|nr:NADH-quinone oxidoreductase subunit NuoE [Rhodocyclus tenuis]MBB4248173.1 NADH-quinone oxidoreductase subunit E [Rhodocyclus tenuis]MBK1679337.1 NADH-quinone oxidoreductase subunit E [Rhodocyclus tenuis]